MKKTKETEVVAEGKLNEIITVYTKRPSGSLRIQTDYQFCPTLAEQHSAHETDLNYLIKKFKPDELQAYINQREQMRQEIIGHDFSREPDLQGAKNFHYKLKQAYESIPEDVRMHFKNHVEFIKFIDNPANAEKMVKLGILTKKQVQANQTTSDAGAPSPDKASDIKKQIDSNQPS